MWMIRFRLKNILVLKVSFKCHVSFVIHCLYLKFKVQSIDINCNLHLYV